MADVVLKRHCKLLSFFLQLLHLLVDAINLLYMGLGHSTVMLSSIRAVRDVLGDYYKSAVLGILRRCPLTTTVGRYLPTTLQTSIAVGHRSTFIDARRFSLML